MTNHAPKILTDREFADLVKNAPLVSIDLIIRDREDRVLLQRRQDRPAKGYWFVPGGRIRKYESAEDAIVRIYQDEIQKTVSDIKINPSKCQLLSVYKHEYVKDNKYTDDSSMLDMKEEDTHYVSIAYEYRVDHFDTQQDVDNLKWFTIPQLLHECAKVHQYTKEFFTNNIHIPKDSGLYSALMSHYIHYDSQFWSRTQIILAIQGAAFVGAYTTAGSLLGAIIMICTAFIVSMVGLLIHRDINSSRVNEIRMDEIAGRLFSYRGPSIPKLRPISLRAEPIRKWLSGQYIIYTIVIMLIVIDLALGIILCKNPTFLKSIDNTNVTAISKPKLTDAGEDIQKQ